MKFPRKIVGRTSSERETNSAALVDEVPAAGVRVDDAARDAMAAQLLREQTRRDALRLGVAAGGGVLAALFADRFIGRGRAAPGDAIGGTTISNTDIDAKRIAAVRIATEFEPTKHAGTPADPWTEAGINAAMADLGAAGGLVFLPVGNWSVRPITVPANNIALCGSGFNTKLAATAGSYTQNTSAMFLLNGRLGVTLADMALDGTGTNTCFGINATGGSDPIISRMRFTNWLGIDTQRARGISVQQNPSSGPPFFEAVISDCVFDGNQIGVVVHRCRYMIIGCRADNHPFDGFYIDGNQAQGSIVGCITYNNARTGINAVFSERTTLSDNTSYRDGTGIQLYSATRMIVQGNTINEALNAGILVNSNTKYSIIADNWLFRQASSGQGQGISVYNGCLYNLIQGNVCNQSGRNGIWVSNGSNENVIIDNICFANSVTDAGYSGIALSTTGNLIQGNRCFDDQVTRTQAYGILETTGADGNYILGNRLDGNLTGPLVVVGPNTIVRGNIGYRTEHRGTATIPSGQSSIVAPHNLVKTPVLVTLGPRAAEVSGAYVSARDATSITIAVPSSVTANRDIDWYAEA